jgi:hypothetical protein
VIFKAYLQIYLIPVGILTRNLVVKAKYPAEYPASGLIVPIYPVSGF